MHLSDLCSYPTFNVHSYITKLTEQSWGVGVANWNRKLTDSYTSITQIYAGIRGIYADRGHKWCCTAYSHWHSCTTVAHWQSDGANPCPGGNMGMPEGMAVASGLQKHFQHKNTSHYWQNFELKL